MEDKAQVFRETEICLKSCKINILIQARIRRRTYTTDLRKYSQHRGKTTRLKYFLTSKKLPTNIQRTSPMQKLIWTVNQALQGTGTATFYHPLYKMLEMGLTCHHQIDKEVKNRSAQTVWHRVTQSSQRHPATHHWNAEVKIWWWKRTCSIMGYRSRVKPEVGSTLMSLWINTLNTETITDKVHT